MEHIDVIATPKYIYYYINFPTSNDLSGNFEVEGDGTMYFYSSTNVASYTFNNSTLPASVVNKIRYSFSIVKSVEGQTAQLVLRKRRTSTKTNTINIVSIPSESSQGTFAVFLHNLDSKITVYDLFNKVNDSNYLGVNSWTNNPKTVIDLPTIDGFWSTGFCDYANNVVYFFGNKANSAIIYCCKYYYSGAKSGQIWNYNDTTQNAASSHTSTYNIVGTTLYCVYNYATRYVYLVEVGKAGFRVYLENTSFSAPYYGSISDFIFYTNAYSNINKPKYNFQKNKFCLDSCYQGDDLTRENNFFLSNTASAQTHDNVSGLTYKCNNGVGNSFFTFSDNTKIANGFTGTAYQYNAQIMICASVKRALLVARIGAQTADSAKTISVYNLANNTVANELIFTDTDVTTCIDADYCNSIDMWVCLSDGTAGTAQGRRTVYFLKPVSDGGTFLKYKDTLAYDSRFLIVNRLPY